MGQRKVVAPRSEALRDLSREDRRRAVLHCLPTR
jgi:hypothetical protein